MRDYPYSKRREDFAIMLLRVKYLLAVHSVESRKGERLDAAAEEYYAFANEFPESKYMAEAKSIFEKTKKKGCVCNGKNRKKGCEGLNSKRKEIRISLKFYNIKWITERLTRQPILKRAISQSLQREQTTFTKVLSLCLAAQIRFRLQ